MKVPKFRSLKVQILSLRLWNLNTNGCNLQEPLHTLTSIKSYKTSDVIGYLRSVLENSKPYAREVFNSPVFHFNLPQKNQKNILNLHLNL